MKKLAWLLVIVLIVGLGAWYWASTSLNRYRTDGEVSLSGLDARVRVVRDGKGMPYIHADNLNDALMALGYVTAQDRLFQMHLTRLLARGRISEIAGERAVPLDTLMRTLGFARAAERHLAILDEKDRGFLEAYAAGVNRYIEDGEGRALEFTLAGVDPEPWTATDSLAITYYMGWGSAANAKTEVISHMLINRVGRERFMELHPVATNPMANDPLDGQTCGVGSRKSAGTTAPGAAGESGLLALVDLLDCLPTLGSNNWAAGSEMSPNGRPIVASDPHLDARMLPGIFHSAGVFLPDKRIVGVALPGIPALIIGRNESIAIGITNAYGDAQDLYVETVDPDNPDNYLENGESIPFDEIRETLRVKDKEVDGGFSQQEITIRTTNRGPVITGVMKDLETEEVMTVRWAPYETMRQSLGMDYLFTARTVHDVRATLEDATALHLNFTFADVHGGLGWQTSGRLPVRSHGDGTVPVSAARYPDPWAGFVPYILNPQEYTTSRGWLGNANNRTVDDNYMYYYSSYFSPYYRMRRLMELLDSPGRKSVDDHWNFQRDVENVLARRLAPIFAEAMERDGDTRDMARVLREWDHRDTLDSTATCIFQYTYRNLARETFRDELGEDLASTMLGTWYFWQERFERMVVAGDSHWFDDTGTADAEETRDDMVVRAAKKAAAELREETGEELAGWRWGDVHQMFYTNPMRREGFGKQWLGEGPIPMAGSGETLYRGLYDFNNHGELGYSAALRMVADLADDDKVAAVLNGGEASRTFHPHQKDQIAAYHSGEKLYWWFSDKAIEEHKASELVFVP